MWQTFVITVVSIIVGMGLVMVFGQDFIVNLTKGKERKRRIKKIRIQAKSILTQAIWEYGEPYGYEVFHKFNTISNNYLDIQTEIRQCLDQVIARLPKYQDFFDQILKMYAEKMHEMYRDEEEFRKRYKKEENFFGSFSRPEIEKIFGENEKSLREKKKAEEKFWTLHDLLQSLGFETWGHRSYKVYLLLKPIGPSQTLPE